MALRLSDGLGSAAHITRKLSARKIDVILATDDDCHPLRAEAVGDQSIEAGTAEKLPNAFQALEAAARTGATTEHAERGVARIAGAFVNFLGALAILKSRVRLKPVGLRFGNLVLFEITCTSAALVLGGVAASWLFNSRRKALILMADWRLILTLPNVRAKRATTAGRQGPD